EVQTGFCRTGKMFASGYWEVEPDIITTAKSISGGLPLSAVTARAEIIESPQVGGIGGTFSGNPVACAAALKTIEIMKRDNFEAKAMEIGEVVRRRFGKMMREFEIIGDVRGRGAMIAMELVKDRKTKEPAADETKVIIKECYEKGLVLLNAGLYSNVLRILVPLVVTKEQLESGLDIIERTVNKFD
ncbi:MAG TPA: aminotransferase class III-fold pyridoxal phosphate-dependent enzyme, partial [Spirochaetes bacterium]|nr:aminotransferase class III-fold pyridoxal phosphate-dependent enzyme [Spirochaetota bacterium]